MPELLITAKAAVAVVIIMLCGCRGVGKLAGPDDISQVRKQRKQAVAGRFAEQRTAVEMAAANSMLEQGDFSGCARALQSVLKREPENEVAQTLLNQVELASGDCADSFPATIKASYVEDANAFGPSDPSSADTSFSDDSDDHDDAVTALAEWRIDEARRLLRARLSTPATTEESAVRTAVLPLRFDHADLSLELAQLAVKRFRGSSALYRTVGLCHYRLDNHEQSEAALRQALALDNGHPLTYFLLSHTLRKLGKDDQAEQCLDLARRANENGTTR